MPSPPFRSSGRRRIPEFVPVPLRTRRDGWTPVRQGEFIGWLAQTGSVREAAARVGCSRESAYRLRRRAGAEGFARAWDFALGLEIPPRKFTREELVRAALDGVLRVIMRRGRYVGCMVRPLNSALLRVLSHYDRACAGIDRAGGGWGADFAQFPHCVSTVPGGENVMTAPGRARV